MEQMFKATIALLHIFSGKAALEEYVQSLSGQKKAQISEISVLNLKASMILHTMATSQSELYLDLLQDGKTKLEQYPVSESALTQVAEFIDQCIVNLRVSEYYIESSLGIEQQALDIFEANETEKELRIQYKENLDPQYLNFFTSRQFAIDHSEIVKQFADLKKGISSFVESAKQTSVVRNSTVMSAVSKGLSTAVLYYDKICMLKSAGDLAVSAYTTYGWTTKSEAIKFVSRAYNEIKKDLEAIA